MKCKSKKLTKLVFVQPSELDGTSDDKRSSNSEFTSFEQLVATLIKNLKRGR